MQSKKGDFHLSLKIVRDGHNNLTVGLYSL